MTKGGRPGAQEGALKATISHMDGGTARCHSREAKGWAGRTAEGTVEGSEAKDVGKRNPGGHEGPEHRQTAGDGKFQRVDSLSPRTMVPRDQARHRGCGREWAPSPAGEATRG